MQRIQDSQQHPAYYQFELLTAFPLRHGIFTRKGGVSSGHFDSLNIGGMIGDDQANVIENSRRMYAALGLVPEQVCTVWQVHGVDTVIANHPPPQRKWLARADGMITNRRDIALSMRYADCVPVLFYDPVHHAAGIAHAGWRGTVNAVVCSVLDAMQMAYDSHPKDILAAIGPSIGPEDYQVGEEVVEQVRNRFGDTSDLITRADDGSAYLNLWEANARLMREAGVVDIGLAGISTATSTDEFFSHRAEAGKTGRFGAVIALNDK